MTFCDSEGDMIGAIRLARAPETKATLKTSLATELLAILRLQPALPIVKVADGLDDNWKYLTAELLGG